MATTQADVDRLQKTLYSGVLRVDHPDGGGVTYHSVEALKSALQAAREELAASAGTSISDAPSFASFSKD